MSDNFVNLHLHTDGSVMDSPASIDTVLDTIKEKGQPGAALTDHGSMVNIVDWHRGCAKRGLKPILGMEAYVSINGIADKESVKVAKHNAAMAIESGIFGTSHLLLLAKNYKGYQNLCKLCAIAHTEGFYYQPRIDYDLLRQHGEGLIVSTACMFGDFAKMLIGKDLNRAFKFAGEMKDSFGDDFYIELQNHGFLQQGEILAPAMKIADQLGINTIVTQDVHYARPQDWKFQDALFCIGTKKQYDSADRRTASQEMYVKTRKQMESMVNMFGVPAKSLDNTLAVLEKVESYGLTPKDYLLPSLFSDKQKSKEYLLQECRKGWTLLISPKIKGNKELQALYKARVDYEMAVIGSMGFCDYFLIVSDFIRWAKSRNIRVGPGRGSAVGCLVAYLTGITTLDPVQYGLLFERFLVEGRPSLPDIDVDVEDRESVIAYLAEKYGKDKVAPIINRTAVTAKAALIKCASILGNYKLGEEISKTIETKRGDTPTFEEALADIPALQVYKRENPTLFELAEGLEGTITHLAGHASGVVVSSIPITDVAPLHSKEGTTYVAYDKAQLEYVKLVKLDVLGLDTLRSISKTLELVKQNHGVDIDVQYLVDHPDDPQAYRTLQNGDCMGLFQFEGNAVRSVLSKIKASTIHDIAAINAIARPGPLDAHIDEIYSRRKFGLDPVEFAHPSLEPILKSTYGLMIYQEQVMEIARVMANYTVPERDQIRKAMSDKDEKKIEIQRARFLKGAAENGYPEDLANSIFENIKLFGGYGFNACLTPTTRVVTINAGIKCIKDIIPGDIVLSVSSEGKIEPAPVSRVFDNGQQDMYRITFDDGSEEECTLNHKWVTPYGKKTTQEIFTANLPVWQAWNEMAGVHSSQGKLFDLPGICKEKTLFNSFEDNVTYERRSDLQGEDEKDCFGNSSSNFLPERNSVTEGRETTKVARAIPSYSFAEHEESYHSKSGPLHVLPIKSGTSNRFSSQGFQKPCLDSKSAREEKGARFYQQSQEYRPRDRRALALQAGGKKSGPRKNKASGQVSGRGNYSAEMDSYKNLRGGRLHVPQCIREGSVTESFRVIERGEIPSRCHMYRRIVSLERLGRYKAYDIEVNHGSHSFILESGLATSNSHAYGYGILVYITAYLKAYYPLEFIVACLNTMLTKDTKPKIAEIAEMVLDIENHGYTLNAPSATYSDSLFTISKTLDKNNNPVVYYALGAIKSISPTGTAEWLNKRPFKTLDDAVLKALECKIGGDDLMVLASVGAFNDLAPNQEYVMETMEDRVAAAKKVIAKKKRVAKKAAEQSQTLNMFDDKQMSAPKEIELTMGDGKRLSLQTKMTPGVRVKNEIEFIGFALTGTLLDPYETHVRSRSNMMTSYFAQNVKSGDSSCHVAGVITNLRKRNDKNGNPYCFLTMSDGRTDVRALVFSSVYQRFADSSWKTGKGIVVDGRKDEKGLLIANDVTFLRRDTDPNADKRKRVFQKEIVPDEEQESFEEGETSAPLEEADSGETPGF